MAKHQVRSELKFFKILRQVGNRQTADYRREPNSGRRRPLNCSANIGRVSREAGIYDFPLRDDFRLFAFSVAANKAIVLVEG